MTVTFQPNNPSRPVIIITEKKQLLSGTTIQITFLNTNQRVAIINNKTPIPNTTISFFINVIMSSAIIGIPPRNIFPISLYDLITSLISRIFEWFCFFLRSLYSSNSFELD